MTQDIQNRAQTPAKSTIQHDYILLDGSSSMETKWWEVLEAIDAYIDRLKAANINSHILLDMFGAQDIQIRNEAIANWTPIHANPFGPCYGGTPLYDAIANMCRKLRDLDPPRCSIVILTDGDENASRYTSLVQAKALLDWCRAKGWQVTFIGADFNNSQQASLLGGLATASIGVQKKLLPDAARSLADKRARYGLYGEPMHFTEGERQQFGGYLAGPSNG